MMKEVLKEPVFTEEIVNIVRSSHSLDEMREELRGYHENDIAQSFELLNRAERNLLYTALDAEWLAEVISYLDNPSEYIGEIGIVKLAEIINEMDADDAIDLWEDIDESVRVKLRPMIDDETKTEIRLINSYDDDEIGSLITTNYIRIRRNLTIRQAMHELILDMAGNVGTQSLAVTIRVLMDENLDAKDKWHLIAKEMKVGFCNGTLLGVLAVLFLGVYIALFKGYTFGRAMLISGCVGISLLVAIVISSLVGTLVPMFFHKVKVDPAVASGPLITTVNDLVAIVTYYGLAWLLLIEMLHIV